MLKRINIGGILIILFTVILLLIVGFTRVRKEIPKNAYIVYLEGKKVGLIEDKNKLYELIDKEQDPIKTNFGVEKVYPPEDLKTIEYTTYSNKLKTPEDIYNIIEEKSTFTIKGYTVTIKPKEQDPIYVNILNKEDLEPALMDAISAFISIEELDAYIKDTQVEITDTGKTIKNVYFDEKITIKESFLSVDSNIITNKDDLTKYLLFGTLEKQDEYTVKEGDTVETVAYNNKLSNEELLIANPNLASINSILSAGQKLNIGLINPLFSIIEESEKVEDVEKTFERVVETNSSLYPSQSYVKQKGKKGLERITEMVQYKNGQIINLVVDPTTIEISAPINEIYVKGTKKDFWNQAPPPVVSTADWGWPTISPYVITSYYGWRWGKLHGAIDISGSGFGSPIFSSTEGVVTKAFKGCADRGVYGSSCGGGMGNYVEIRTTSGLTIYYAHMRNDLRVSLGQSVTKGQRIGSMGSSGSSTGTHLHYEVRDDAGRKYNPCRDIFSC